MKVAIVGLGFVGNALFRAIKDDVCIYKVDPKLGTAIEDLVDFKPNIIFITVPTPMHDNGDQDTSILEKVLDQINKLNINSLVVIKSTVLPNIFVRLLHWGFVILSPKYPPCWKHRCLAFTMNP